MDKKLIVALILGLLAGGAHFAYVRKLEAKVTGGKDVTVLVLVKDQNPGDVLKKTVVATREVPEAFVDKRVITPVGLDEVLGLPLAVSVKNGQMLQWSDFMVRDEASAVDLATLVGPGQRAMTIPVNVSLSMGGNLRPGHRVDILGTFDESLFPKSARKSGSVSLMKNKKITVALLQNLTVLATGRDTGKSTSEAPRGKSFRTVTLAVSLEESELLAFSSTQGSLSLVLRGEHDLSIVDGIPEKSIEDIWDAERRNALQKKKTAKRRGIERLKAQ